MLVLSGNIYVLYVAMFGIGVSQILGITVSYTYMLEMAPKKG